MPLLLSMASKALYSHSATHRARALRTIRTLAILAPEFVLPQVYERALVALSSDTDAHQAPVSFHVVSQTLFDACASMGVPFLRRFLPPLADLALAALDANDSKKASAALRFFSVLFAAVPLRAVPASATDDEAEDAREVLEQLVGVPEQLIRRLLALLAQSEAQRPASDAAVTSDSASASDEQHELHEDIVGAVEMALQQFDRALPQLRDCCALIVRSVAPLVPHSAAATYSAVFGAAVRAIAAADARAAVMRDLLARFAPTWRASPTSRTAARCRCPSRRSCTCCACCRPRRCTCTTTSRRFGHSCGRWRRRRCTSTSRSL